MSQTTVIIRNALLSLAVLSGGILSAQVPAITTNGTVNAADYSRTFAPGTLISIFGSNLATSIAQAQSLPLPVTLVGTSVELVGQSTQLPLWYVSSTQINAQLPYGLADGSIQLRVSTAAGTSSVDTITIQRRAPRVFTVDLSGTGSALVTNSSYAILTTSVPAKPADEITVWMSGLGETSTSVTAGDAAPGLTSGSSPAAVSDTVTATIGGVSAPVTFAGLSPGSSGLYQVNIQAPFVLLTGAASLQITVGTTTSQSSVTVPYRQLGFYYAIVGGKTVSGQSLTGLSGETSDLAFRHSDGLAWGSEGLDAWSKNTGLTATSSSITGLAVTLKNGSTVVYDNNGIEDKSFGTFYDNTGGGSNSTKPGLTNLYSMSNYFPMLFGGYIKLAAATTITELDGYFDSVGDLTLPFDPANPYVKYRMNIWSNATGSVPTDTKTFVGDVFTTDQGATKYAAGTFSTSDTGATRISSSTSVAPAAIWRVTYKLTSPVTLPAGEYWFSHDASVLSTAVVTSSAAITTQELRGKIDAQKTAPKNVLRLSLFGQELTWERSTQPLDAQAVRPTSAVQSMQ